MMICLLTLRTVCRHDVLHLEEPQQSLPSDPLRRTYDVTVTAKEVGSTTIPGSTPGSTTTIYGNQNQVSLPFTVNVTIQ